MPAPRTRTALARWFSIAGHPFVLIGVLVGSVAARKGTPEEAVRTTIVVIAFTVVPLAILMIRQVRAGAWENADASNVAERPILFVVGLLSLISLLGYLLVARPQSFLVRGAAETLGMLAVCAAATRWIKVSLHMAFATFCATTLLAVGAPAGWVLTALVPALAWSRLVLKRHRPLEIMLGALVGLISGLVLVFI